MIKCLLCNNEYRVITSFHMKKAHGITIAEYKEKFPGCEIFSSETKKKIGDKSRKRMKGRTWNELYGVEKANQLKEVFRETMFKRYRDGIMPTVMTGPHVRLYTAIKQQCGDIFKNEYQIGPYIVDIVCEQKRIAIEVQGEYFHARPEATKLNYFQQQNFRRDKTIKTYMKNKGWILILAWENDINSNLEKEVERILKALKYELPPKPIDYSKIFERLTCKLCGKELSWNQKIQKRKYCSRECYYNGRSLSGTRPEVQHHVCKVCKKSFSSIYNRSTCSRTCQYELFRTVEKETRICIACDTNFVVDKRKRNKFCSSTCYHSYSRGKSRKEVSFVRKKVFCDS